MSLNICLITWFCQAVDTPGERLSAESSMSPEQKLENRRWLSQCNQAAMLCALLWAVSCQAACAASKPCCLTLKNKLKLGSIATIHVGRVRAGALRPGGHSPSSSSSEAWCNAKQSASWNSVCSWVRNATVEDARCGSCGWLVTGGRSWSHGSVIILTKSGLVLRCAELSHSPHCLQVCFIKGDWASFWEKAGRWSQVLDIWLFCYHW